MAIVILGAGGRLGQLLRPVFPVEALWHSRKDVDIEDTNTLCHALAQADAVSIDNCAEVTVTFPSEAAG